MTILFCNNGVLDPRAIVTMGVNAKTSNSAIGYFGTGLKYSIAVLLRNNQEITITSCGERYEFDTIEAEIRGQSFSIVRMNGQELGFTTELGKNWSLENAYRELYSNCMDEAGDVNPVMDGWETVICVKGGAFDDVHRRRSDFLIETEPFAVLGNIELHKGKGNGLFYKGILANEMTQNSLYRVNILSDCELTEDRTIKNLFYPKVLIARELLDCRDKALIKELLGNCPLFNDLDYEYTNQKASDECLEVIRGLRAEGKTLSNSLLRKFFEGKRDEPWKGFNLTPVQCKQLSKAKSFIEKLLGEGITYEIICTNDMPSNILGCAKGGKIWLSKKVFEMGTKMVAITMLEEWLHLEKEVQDETRQMQDAMFELIVTIGENHITGEPL